MVVGEWPRHDLGGTADDPVAAHAASWLCAQGVDALLANGLWSARRQAPSNRDVGSCAAIVEELAKILDRVVRDDIVS